MTKARVMIDLKEGVIEIEGTTEFVEKYMALYAPGPTGLKVAAPPLEKKPRASTKMCLKTVKALIGAGFFAQQRFYGEIKTEVIGKGGPCSDTSLRNALKKIVNKKKLTVSGNRRGTRYSQQADAKSPSVSSDETQEFIDVSL